MRKLTAALGAALLSLAFAAPASAAPFPDELDLPNGWLPEGVAIGPGPTIYAGSRANGAVWKADLRTGEGEVLVQGVAGRVAVGLKSDPRSGLLFVSGGPTGDAFVYDARTGAEVEAYDLADAPTFINDVTITRDAAWFTDSQAPRLFRVALGARGVPTGEVEVVQLTGDWQQVAGFNANGIAATPDGKTLLVVNSTVGVVYAVDPATGVATAIQADTSLTAGDGILLRGNLLYVVRNQLNEIAVLRLSPDLSSAALVDTLTDPDFDVPTTVAAFGSSLYAVNARFTTPPTADTEYTIVRVDRR